MNINKKNQDLFLSKLNCKMDDYSAKISALVKSKNKDELYQKFAKKFLNYIPVDYRSENKIELFGDFTDEAFEFFKTRKLTERKVEIAKIDFQRNPAITISIIIENRPFIIDSLNCLISRLGLQTIFTFHPMIFSKRDNDGRLIDILNKHGNANHESLVFIKALGNFNEETIKTLKTEINKIIDLVDYTYYSWQKLLGKLIGVTTDILQHKEIYEQRNLPADETLEFLNWLQKDNFTFLGMTEFETKSMKITHEDGVKAIWQDNSEEINAIIDFSKNENYASKLVILGKLNKISPVHRNALVDYILVKHLDDKGNYNSGTIIFGLYGTALYFQSIKNLPILREKMNHVIDESDFPPNSYNVKKLKNIIESLPREMLIQIDESDLFCMCLHMLSGMISLKLKLFIQQDWSNSFINIILFMPRERLTPDAYNNIVKYLSKKFESKIITDNITVVAQDFAHLFATIPVKDKSKLNFSSAKLESDLVKITTNWSDELLQKLCEKYGEYEAGKKHKIIAPIFPNSYRHKFCAKETIEDFGNLKLASKKHKKVFNLLQKKSSEFILKIYSSATPITLSEILPSIENLGFIAIDEQSFLIKRSSAIKQSWIYEFMLSSPIEITVSFAILKKNIETALDKINEGVFSSDILSKLMVLSGMDWTKILLLKALTSYLNQTDIQYSKDYIKKTLIKHYLFTELLVRFFDAKFNPNWGSLQNSVNCDNSSSITEKIFAYLDKVPNSSEDKILRNFYLTIDAAVRTNFYQLGPDDNDQAGQFNFKIKNYISFKFNSYKVPDLPAPRMYAEIFVYANNFEAIHLRGGEVARGGLRWSSRIEDYRTEVLGLVKAQMTKNSVIVPVGSKGGFVVNFEQDSISSSDEYMDKVISCYQNFLRGMLDITDNLVNGQVIRPANTIIYDAESSYLVVAADKGTATFSDYANAISHEYNFWLGDAFASGGSVGYDHKKMGITAKGAWISAQFHFREIGIDIQSEPFTVIGIGDMSGDVFGNGMLLSKYIKLVAAFNHMHIFIDPDPDYESSYGERERLFNMPKSKWSDYNSELISKGGGVFDRSAKTLIISQEIQNLLNLDVVSITPDDLIKAVLKAEVDLLWNGGIGTYIKASKENNIDIGDKANDNVRCDANEIRAKVICEGGNVGMSQLARIEYSRAGGLVNTDFIDNSAGVDCSDHEVNIKIALNSAVSSRKITPEERNILLLKMTKQVENLVLLDNYDQNQALCIMKKSPVINIEAIGQLIKDLEQEELLNRKVEFLPNQVELSQRIIAKENITRPELAVLLSYSKMSIEKQLINSDIANDKYFEKYLIDYFPELMQENFYDEIVNHPLRKEIIYTSISNKLVNQIGGSLINVIKKETGGFVCDIIRAYAVIYELFDLDNLWHQVEALGPKISEEIKIDMFTNLTKIMRRGISWFIKNTNSPLDVNDTINEHKDQIVKIKNRMEKLLFGETKIKFDNKIKTYCDVFVPKELAINIASLELLISSFDIIHISKQSNYNEEEMANLYFETGDTMDIDWLRKSCEAQIDESYWNRLSIQSLKDDFYDKQKRLVSKIINYNTTKINLTAWLKEHEQIASIFTDFVKELKTQEVVNLNMLILANKKLELFLRKL